MERNEIKIIVLGATASGKSTIAKVIGETLANLDLNVKITDDEDFEDTKHWDNLNKRIDFLAQRGVNVEVYTAQASILPRQNLV
jgi:uridine kinase